MGKKTCEVVNRNWAVYAPVDAIVRENVSLKRGLDAIAYFNQNIKPCKRCDPRCSEFVYGAQNGFKRPDRLCVNSMVQLAMDYIELLETALFSAGRLEISHDGYFSHPSSKEEYKKYRKQFEDFKRFKEANYND